jgi:DNA-binding IclR family transcriptional regulator
MAESGKKTAEKVLDVLTLFNSTRTELTADEISHLVGAPRSTTYRYLRILRDKGFLHRTSTGGYQLGLALVQLGRLARGRLDFSAIARPVMEQIAQQSRETVLLTRLSGKSAVCIDRVEGSQTVRISFEVGQVQPLHGGASSKILLAFVDENRWEKHLQLPLERFTDETVTDLQVLKDQLGTIRSQGYCVSDSEVDWGVRAVSVPIVDAQGAVIAALSTAGPSFRMDDATISRHLELLRAGAKTIHDQLADRDL